MIRALCDEDVDAFIKIRKDSLELDPMSFGANPFATIYRAKTIKDLKAKNHENFILGWFSDDVLVGTLGFIRNQNPKTRHKGFIWGVFVYEAYRGQGIGKQLLESALQKVARLDGLKKVTLGASDISKRALSLYRKMGFIEYGREDDAMLWDERPMAEILFHKYI